MERFVDNIKTVIGAGNATVSSLSEDAISLENYDKVQIELIVTISSGTDTGAVTLLQSTDAAGSDDKTLAFAKYYVNAAVSTADTLTKTTATSNTFNAGGAAATRHYIIEIMAEDLDQANDFKFVRLNLADITNGTATLLYHCYKSRFGGDYAQLKSAVA